MNQPFVYSNISLAHLPKIAERILLETKHLPKVWLMEGCMGAGKTTLIAALTSALGVQDKASSPTFSLINEYALPTNGLIYHFDLYRTKNNQEIVDLGLYEYLDSGEYCWIEWPSKGKGLWDIPHLLVNLAVNEDETRTVTIEPIN